jgi:hypothetical protein
VIVATAATVLLLMLGGVVERIIPAKQGDVPDAKD